MPLLLTRCITGNGRAPVYIRYIVQESIAIKRAPITCSSVRCLDFGTGYLHCQTDTLVVTRIIATFNVAIQEGARRTYDIRYQNHIKN